MNKKTKAAIIGGALLLTGGVVMFGGDEEVIEEVEIVEEVGVIEEVEIVEEAEIIQNQVILTVQEWRQLIDLYNEELEGGLVLEDIRSKADILDKLDEKILEKAQKKPKAEKDLIEALLVKRSDKNKDIINKLKK